MFVHSRFLIDRGATHLENFWSLSICKNRHVEVKRKSRPRKTIQLELHFWLMQSAMHENNQRWTPIKICPIFWTACPHTLYIFLATATTITHHPREKKFALRNPRSGFHPANGSTHIASIIPQKNITQKENREYNIVFFSCKSTRNRLFLLPLIPSDLVLWTWWL